MQLKDNEALRAAMEAARRLIDEGYDRLARDILTAALEGKD